MFAESTRLVLGLSELAVNMQTQMKLSQPVHVTRESGRQLLTAAGYLETGFVLGLFAMKQTHCSSLLLGLS
jgi:hypothetical protein